MTASVALLGAGRIGRVHAKAVTAQPDARLIAVADAVDSAAQAVADAYGCEVRSIDQIAVAADVDAVIICTPTDTHADLIEQFAHAGKAIFCEKPVHLDASRVRACLKTVEDTATPLMLGFNRRFDPHFRALKAAIDDGSIGAVEQVVLTSRDPGLPPMSYIDVSGGIFRDMMIHDFDMALFLLGEPIRTVAASAGTLVEPELRAHNDFDTATVLLTSVSGKQVTILNSRRATYGYDQRIEVHGSKGMVSAENMRLANIEIANGTGFTRPPLLDFFMTRYTEAYAAEIAAFLAALASGGAMPTTGQDGLNALLLADAALQAATSGQVVTLA
ncbi:inositol 2-dehydrogenase [Tropicimonas sp. IMCC34043]|uniref:inositol 2-dehydrogenase n=1 Tax=Tropicimonas sp. IMCC34043 TaxID=2248760 RepID=UPI000E22C590|nr:inositol 2-dehydrogenase [Tropicimonas sp. IMCC34043]